MITIDIRPEDRCPPSPARTHITQVVIAHRLSTIMSADQILVIESGSVIERGTHAELVERGGKYERLWATQREGAGEEAGGEEEAKKDEVEEGSVKPLVVNDAHHHHHHHHG